ncbi:hypothetical protein ACFRNT_14290 [Streptomyces sp. NPDC056697]|uniref:hypothetical protein n=1 Tax=Streptomyces sp. NPDC056697 TaxID=3345915 RepID=UPI0036C15D1D
MNHHAPAHCAISRCGRPLREEESHRAACSLCEHRIRGWLTELPHQMPLLAASLERDGGGPAIGGTSGRAVAPVPLRLDVLNLLGPAASSTVHDPHADQTGPVPILAILGDWADHLATDRGQAPPAHRTVESCTGYLAAHLPYALARGWIAELHAELGELVNRIRGITRTEPRRRSLPAPCPGTDCRTFGLVEIDWADYIECTVCGRLLTRAEYDDHAAAVLPPLHRLAILIAANTPEKRP